MYTTPSKLLDAFGADELSRMMQSRHYLSEVLTREAIESTVNNDEVPQGAVAEFMSAIDTAISDASAEVATALRAGGNDVDADYSATDIPSICAWLVVARLDAAPSEHSSAEIRSARSRLKNTWSKSSNSDSLEQSGSERALARARKLPPSTLARM